MPGFLMHVNVGMQCLHQAPATVVPAQPRVLVMGLPVMTLPAQITVLGCLFTIPGPKPQPCVQILWQMPAARVLVMGKPAGVVLAPGIAPAMGISPPAIPNGPPVVSAVQTRVIAM
jgi:hypothetical protein